MKLMQFVLVAILALLSGCSDEEKQENVRPVRVIKVEPTSAIAKYTFNGIARSDIAAKLSFEVSGRVKSVDVRAGQRVEKGDTIATLDDSYFKLKVNEVKASLKDAQARYANAKSYYARIKQLYVNRSSSLSDLDNARASKESAYANYKAMKNRLEQAKLKLTSTKLIAPISGVISEVMVHKGENIASGMPVATISSTQNIEVPVSVPGSLIDNIKLGQEVSVRFDALKDKSFKATVVEVSTTSNIRTTTFPVVVRLQEKYKKIKPGMSASVEFTFTSDTNNAIFIVPVYALLEDAKGNYLFIVEEVNDKGVGVIRRFDVVRGKLVGDGVVIKEGLYNNARVLTAGMHKVQENQKVRVQE